MPVIAGREAGRSKRQHIKCFSAFRFHGVFTAAARLFARALKAAARGHEHLASCFAPNPSLVLFSDLTRGARLQRIIVGSSLLSVIYTLLCSVFFAWGLHLGEKLIK
jgi:hypothetical protein